MKKLIFLLAFSCTLSAVAQEQPTIRPGDSLFYYQRESGRLMRQVQDSLRNSEYYKTLQQNIARLRGKSQDFAGLVLVSGIQHTNFSDFNKSIVQDGFPEMDPISWQLGFGISSKTENIMLDMYFGVGGFETTSSKVEESITASFSNFFQFDLGYDLAPSRTINLYPYLGISFRISSLEYETPAQINPNYTNISNLLINDRSISASSSMLGYQAGLGLDFMLSHNDKRGTGHYFFIKAGVNRPVWADKYKMHDIKYDPNIKQGDWLISFGIKFANFE